MSLVDVERLREIAEVEFTDIVVEAFSPGLNELRVILLLNETEGLTVEEISQKLKQRPGTVGRKLAESKRIFRERLIEARLGATRGRKLRAVHASVAAVS